MENRRNPLTIKEIQQSNPAQLGNFLIAAMETKDYGDRDLIFEHRHSFLAELKDENNLLKIFKAALPDEKNHWVCYEIIPKLPNKLANEALLEVLKYPFSPEKINYFARVLCQKIILPSKELLEKLIEHSIFDELEAFADEENMLGATEALEIYLVEEIFIKNQRQKIEKLYRPLKEAGLLEPEFIKFFDQALSAPGEKILEVFLNFPQYFPPVKSNTYLLSELFINIHTYAPLLFRHLLEDIVSQVNIWEHNYEEWNAAINKVLTVIDHSDLTQPISITDAYTNSVVKVSFLTFAIGMVTHILNKLYDNSNFQNGIFRDRIQKSEENLLYLIKKLANHIPVRTPESINPFFFGIASDCKHSHIERPYQETIVNVLLERKTSVDDLYHDGNSPIDFAVIYGNYSVAKTLLPHVINQLSPTKKNELFMYAMEVLESYSSQSISILGYIRIADLLLKNGAQSTAQRENGETAFAIVLKCLTRNILNEEKQHLIELIKTFIKANDVNRLILENFLRKEILQNKEYIYLERIFIPLKQAQVLSLNFLQSFEADLHKQQHAATTIKRFWRAKKSQEQSADKKNEKNQNKNIRHG